MKIKSISICNYKCFEKLENVPFYDFTTIIGENDSGKSSLIKFLDLMLNNNAPAESDFFKKVDSGNNLLSSDSMTGIINFVLDDDEKNLLSNYLNQDGGITLKKTFYKENPSRISIFTSKFDDERLHHYNDFKMPELKQLLSDLKLPEKSTNDLRKESIANYIEENKATIPSYYGYLDISFNTFKKYLPKLIIYNAEDYKNPNNKIFEVLRLVFENEIYHKPDNGIKELRDENLKEIIERVKNKLIEEISQFKGHILKYNKNITDISIDPEIDLSSGLQSSQISIQDETGISVNFDNKGLGTRKRLFLSIFEWDKEVNKRVHNDYAIRCYDEPDNNLHIEAQRSLYKTIRSISDETGNKNQVVLCTHSLFLVDAVPSSSINLIKKDVTGKREVEFLKAYDDTEIQFFINSMCREMGLSNSHIFFEKCFILVEGSTEKNFLPHAYKTIFNANLAEDGITLIDLEGNGAAVNFLKLLIKNKEHQIILFLDKDTENFDEKVLTKALKSLYRNSDDNNFNNFVNIFCRDKVLFAGNKEFEDAFSNKILTKVLNTFRPKENSSWSESEIQSLRDENKFSDEILKIVASKNCTPKYLSKPQLGSYLGKVIDKDEMPSVVLDLFKRARIIAGIDVEVEETVSSMKI